MQHPDPSRSGATSPSSCGRAGRAASRGYQCGGETRTRCESARGISILPLSVAKFYQRADLVAVPINDIGPNKVSLAWLASRRSRTIHEFAALAGTADWVMTRMSETIGAMKLWGTIALLARGGGPLARAEAGEPQATATTVRWPYPRPRRFARPGQGCEAAGRARRRSSPIRPLSQSGARGMTAAVVDDNWTWSGAAGKDAVGTPLRPTTAMGVASITKTFVAAEIMLLAKAGKVDLDAPLSKYVKHRLTANSATVRQHLMMTSGVPNYLPDDYGRLDQAIKAAPGKHWTRSRRSPTTPHPSARPEPSTTATPASAARPADRKGHRRPLATVLRRDLATPAGLKHAAFQDGEKPQPPLAVDARNPSAARPRRLPSVPRRRQPLRRQRRARRRRPDRRPLGLPAVLRPRIPQTSSTR